MMKEDTLKCITSNSKYINLKDFIIGSTYCKTTNVSVYPYWISSCAYALNRKAMALYINLFEQSNTIKNSDCLQFFFHDIA